MSAALLVHGHFYQPPREDPWLGGIPREPSAAPFHDWNERILEECYRPFARAGLFSRISFDVGPTLLLDLERRAPEVYAAILEGDRAARARLGFGSALAHPPVHAILPLLSPRERRVEVRAGVRDFERRFLRRPEGFWLPECAVDSDTLAALGEEGISLVVLGPRQAAAFRDRLGGPWRDAADLDASVPYRISLPGGREIAAFFYDSSLSSALAFGGLASDGARLGEALLAALRSAPGRAVSVATDGETFGHHSKGGVEALAAALDAVEKEGFRLATFASVLATAQPLREATVVEPSSWSCPHGVGRWERACGCSVVPGAATEWRGPLREAIVGAKRALDDLFEERAGALLREPWLALAELPFPFPSRAAAASALAPFAKSPLGDEQVLEIATLFEMERQGRLAQTSCGWFFDDFEGLEPVQILRHAARALELATAVGLAESVRQSFEETLSTARSSSGLDGGALLRERALAPPPGGSSPPA